MSHTKTITKTTTTTKTTIVSERTTTTIERISSNDNDCYWTPSKTDIFAEFRKYQKEDLKATMAPTLAKAEAAIAASVVTRTIGIPAVIEGLTMLNETRAKNSVAWS
tara:strand:- start:170 stop:490 length:321 start_codon:yes stop_codon:yes gene_type:complete